MEQYQEVCRITRSVPNYTCILLDFICRLGSYVKGLLKKKRCNSVAVMVLVQFWCICETALKPDPAAGVNIISVNGNVIRIAS